MVTEISKSRQVVGKRRTHKRVQERGNMRRKQLLDAAEEMLESLPIEELSFKQISAKASVPEGSAYHFFANRYDLLSALAARIAHRFGGHYRAPVTRQDIVTWPDLVDVLVDRAITLYLENPAAMKIWLGGRTPAQVRLADHFSEEKVSTDLQVLFEKYFVLPDLPRDYDIFFYFLELTDVPLSLSVIENGSITQQAIKEAKRVGRGYLSTYFPPDMEKAK